MSDSAVSESPAPVTPAPVTPAPVTPAPVTSVAVAVVLALLSVLVLSGCTRDSEADAGAPDDFDSSGGSGSSGDAGGGDASLLAEFPDAFEPPRVRPEPMAGPKNAGFDGGLSGNCPKSWTCEASGSPTAAPDGDVAKDGKESLRLRFSEPDGKYRVTSERLPVRSGRKISVEVPLRSSIPGGGAESLSLAFYDADGELLETETTRSSKHDAKTWYTLDMSTSVPDSARTATVSVEAGGYDRTVWFDRVRLDDRPRVEVWGDTRVRRDDDGGRAITLRFRTPSEQGLYVGVIELFDGEDFYVAGPNTLKSERGRRVSYELENGPTYVPKKSSIRVPQGKTVTITVRGKAVDPKGGSAYPKVVLVDPVNEERYHVWVARQNVTDTKQLRSLVRYVYADKLSSTVRGLADYLDERRRQDGAWSITHKDYPDTKPDPMAIAWIVEGYTYLHQASGKKGDAARAKAGLDWLVAHQGDEGGYGLPWPFGSSTGHLSGPEHYPGRDVEAHPPGHPYGITTAVVGNVLVQGYREFGDERYLKAAKKAADYLLRSENGFRWVNEEKTRGSIPYCTVEPVMPADDPRAQEHDVVPALRNTAVEVYNIDGSTLQFLTGLHEITGNDELVRYGDALARNLVDRMHPDGEMPYAWYEQGYYSGGYARIVFNGLREWGQHRGEDGRKFTQAADRGFSWLANEVYAALIPTDNYSEKYGPGPSGDAGDYINRMLDNVRADGSFSGGKHTREDAEDFAILAELMMAVEQ